MIMEIAEKARQIESMVNTYCHEELEELGERLAEMHPTLQQNFMRVVRAFIKTQAEKKYWDKRNEDTVKICRELWRILKETDYCGGLPLI